MKIHEAQLSRQTDHGKTQFVGEASDLGFEPGVWPHEIEMTIGGYGGCETVKFTMSRHVGHDDIVAMVYVEYQTGNYDELHIIND